MVQNDVVQTLKTPQPQNGLITILDRIWRLAFLQRSDVIAFHPSHVIFLNQGLYSAVAGPDSHNYAALLSRVSGGFRKVNVKYHSYIRKLSVMAPRLA